MVFGYNQEIYHDDVGKDEIYHDDVGKDELLCIPNDNLEDVDFFPNFSDDLIRLTLLAPFDDEDFDSVGSRDSMIPCDRETGLLLIQDKESRDADILSLIQDEESRQEIDWEILSKKPSLRNAVRSRDPMLPYERETGLSYIQDEESRDAVFSYELETDKEIREKSSKKPSVRRPCLSVKRWICSRRICSHCQAEKTPQWREGPNGPRTLCNACGVRYKSGRLVPEYRPAKSPSFDSRKHSNFHKKIVRKKIVRRSCRKEM